MNGCSIAVALKNKLLLHHQCHALASAMTQIFGTGQALTYQSTIHQATISTIAIPSQAENCARGIRTATPPMPMYLPAYRAHDPPPFLEVDNFKSHKEYCDEL